MSTQAVRPLSAGLKKVMGKQSDADLRKLIANAARQPEDEKHTIIHTLARLAVQELAKRAP